MRSKSDSFQKNKTRIQKQLSGLLLIGICTLSCAANGQDKHVNDDGAQLPAPPAIKHRGGGDGLDPQFEPQPIDTEGPPSFNRRTGQPESGGVEERFRRRQRLQRQFEGGDGEGPDGMPMQGRRGGFGPGSGGPGGFGPGRGGGMRGERFGLGGMPGKQLDLTPLGLNEEQKTKIQQMREQSKNKIKELHKTLITKQTEMRSLMYGAESTETEIRAARKGLLKIQEQIDEINFNDLLGIRKLLTLEQKKKLPDCMPGKAFARGGRSPGQQPFEAGFHKQGKEEFSQKPSAELPSGAQAK